MLELFRPAVALAFITSIPSPSRAAQVARPIDAEEAKLAASDAGVADYFGHAVDLDGSRAVIGAVWDDHGAAHDAGSVYVFERADGSWSQSAKLVPPTSEGFENFGAAVAVEGDTIVVGAPLDTIPSSGAVAESGSVYVFVRCNGVWIEQAHLVHPLRPVGARFGSDVDIDGNTIVVGSHEDDSHGVDAGSAWVFVRDDSDSDDPCDDVWVLEGELTPSILQPGAYFGSVAVRGDLAAVGARGLDAPETDRGGVFLFERTGGVWSEVGGSPIVAPDGQTGDQFGFSVVVHENTILAGAPLHAAGAAYTFTLAAGAWSFQDKLVPEGATDDHEFGHALDLDGDVALVGAHGYGARPSLAYLSHRDGADWLQDRVVSACDGTASDEFGKAVALDGATALVGARLDDDGAADAGAAIMFEISRGEFDRFGFGDGSGTSCPCSNASGPFYEQGCVNSSGWGAKLSPAGTDSASADDLRLLACNLIPEKFALLFHGATAIQAGAGVVFGDGLRVVGGAGKRHSPPQLSDASGHFEWGPGLGGSTGWLAGSVVHFQVWYRDQHHGACTSGFNLSNGVTVAFRP